MPGQKSAHRCDGRAENCRRPLPSHLRPKPVIAQPAPCTRAGAAHCAAQNPAAGTTSDRQGRHTLAGAARRCRPFWRSWLEFVEQCSSGEHRLEVPDEVSDNRSVGGDCETQSALRIRLPARADRPLDPNRLLRAIRLLDFAIRLLDF